ncbi:ATP-binding protein [Melittangium boletus]|uniref:ATP-binding protein n=1 Tax=Melittangium boletus TaxID=83453 RepID=UPI003DA408B4
MDEGLTGGGEMAARIRAFDWTRTPLGPPERWPQSLKTAVSICLDSRFPMIVRWGEELIALYNDAYSPILGRKHPGALGAPGLSRAVWGDPDTRAVIEPMLRGVLTRGEATWSADQQLILERHGFREEVYFTFSYSPIRVESGAVGGVFTAVSETTQQVVGERRLRVLRELTLRTAEVKTAEETYAVAASVLDASPQDVPFCLLYVLEPDGQTATLRGQSGSIPTRLAPRSLPVNEPTAPWPLMLPGAARDVDVREEAERGEGLPGGPWPEPARSALVQPLTRGSERPPTGFLVAGLSPRLPVDPGYRDFIAQVAHHIAEAIAQVRVYEEERQRAESLAELDRAKTAFFSNVSHEFRTPLTLMLGPAEELRSGAFGPLTPAQSAQVDTLHRNALRLLKLVNALLDFSRIEAGRVQATYQPTDLSALTGDLASVFRSAVVQAGLTLTLDCPPLSEPVHVDRDLWEKIVLNLLSNAFKYTFEGGITVALREDGGQAVLTVADTGTGIPPEALPHLFERFYRVEGARSRSHEGSGIGLALVRELVKMHAGTLSVASTVGQGTCFTVTIPLGVAHLPAERLRVSSEPARALSEVAAPYVQEALRWLPEPREAAPTLERQDKRGHILLADDNADMRDYVARLLRAAGHEVRVVADGVQALAAAREQRPDLVLTDVMMPGLDGFGLLEALRANERTHTLPVILLSARAGEESRLEGLEQGADDYLVKPFGARELLTRVRAHLELSRLRAEAQSERFRSFVLNVPGAVYVCDPEAPWRFKFMSEPVLSLTGYPASEFLEEGRTWAPLVHPEDLANVEARIARAVDRHTPYELEYRIMHADGLPRWVSEVGRALYDEHGKAWSLEGILFDITSRKATEEALQQYERQVSRTIAENATSALYMADAEGRCTFMNPAAERMTGHTFADIRGQKLHTLLHPTHTDAAPCPLESLLTGRAALGAGHEDVFVRVSGEPLPVAVSSSPLLRGGQRVATVLEARDLTEQKRAEASLQEASRRKDEFLAMLAHELRNPLAPVRSALKLLTTHATLDEKSQHALDVIERQTTNLARLVDDLLDVSRITRGRIELRKSPVALPALVDSALQSVQPLLDERRHEVSVTLPRKPLYTFGDAVRIEQIIVNLITNAAKYTDPEGLLRVSLERAGTVAEIRVKDSGIGIAPEMLGRVFNLFEQAERGLDRSQGGLGIGLTVVKNLVDLHGGTIEARSEGVGRGSEFIVRLPLSEGPATPTASPSPASPAPAPVPESAPPPSTRRILVVDDNVDAADTLAELLQTWDHTVWQAHDGHAALKAAEEHRPDVVLLDIGLPGMDGYEVARRLRAGPLGPGLTLVALTGYGQASDRSRALEAGFDKHFVKPVDIDGLENFLRRSPKPVAPAHDEP